MSFIFHNLGSCGHRRSCRTRAGAFGTVYQLSRVQELDGVGDRRRGGRYYHQGYYPLGPPLSDHTLDPHHCHHFPRSFCFRLKVLVLAIALFFPLLGSPRAIAAPTFQDIQETYFGSFNAAIDWIQEYLLQIFAATMFTSLLSFWLKTNR